MWLGGGGGGGGAGPQGLLGSGCSYILNFYKLFNILMEAPASFDETLWLNRDQASFPPISFLIEGSPMY